MATLGELNGWDPPTAAQALVRCCGASRWVELMLASRPFRDAAHLHTRADEVWAQMGEVDILEAFGHHPRIGDLQSLQKKFATTASWASGEQGGVKGADVEVLEALAEGNRRYEEKFGYIFIVCATGKTAAEMLELLTLRLPNHPQDELAIAAAEQAKITHIRLEKLLT